MLLALAIAQTLLLSPMAATHRGRVELTSQGSLAFGIRCANGSPCPRWTYSLAMRLDVLALRSTPRSFGIGPFVSVRSDEFLDVTPSVGASLLIPVSETFPLVVSGGGAVRIDRRGVAAGVLERIWWGPRSFNYASPYVLSAGIFVEARQFADVERTVDVIVGIDADLEFAAIPFILFYNWVHPGEPH